MILLRHMKQCLQLINPLIMPPFAKVTLHLDLPITPHFEGIDAPITKLFAYDFIANSGGPTKPVFIFQRPLGGAVYTPHRKMDELAIAQDIIQPIAQIIQECKRKKISHRSIQPNHLYICR